MAESDASIAKAIGRSAQTGSTGPPVFQHLRAFFIETGEMRLVSFRRRPA
jgi:hypothetical protein